LYPENSYPKKHPTRLGCPQQRKSGLLFVLYSQCRSFISNLYVAKSTLLTPVDAGGITREGETLVPAVAFLLSASSIVWRKVRRTLKRVITAAAESRMHRAQIEIDRYHRIHAPISPADNGSD
jgi:hypothetical protein